MEVGTAGYYEYLVLRSDNYAWGEYDGRPYSEGQWNSIGGKFPKPDNMKFDWKLRTDNLDKFFRDMNGANVVFTHSRRDDKLMAHAEILTREGVPYYELS